MRRLVRWAQRVHKRHWLLPMALRHDSARTTLALATLGGHPQLHLNVVEARPGLRMADQGFVIDAAADTNDHGGSRQEGSGKQRDGRH